MSKQKVKRIHNDGVTAEVLASTVPTWVRHGWTVVDDGSSETGSNEPPQVDEHQLSLLDDENKE